MHLLGQFNEESLKMPPYVSIIMPAYNIASLLELNLYSLAGQDYPAARLEVIVADDGSVDNTVAMCRSLQLPYTFKLLAATSNMGRAKARNQGIAVSEGDIVIFCDGDTLQPPAFVKNHVAFHRQNNHLVLGSRPVYEHVCYTHLYKGFSDKQKQEILSLLPGCKDDLRSGEEMRLLNPGQILADFAAVRKLSVARPHHPILHLMEEMGEFSSLPIDWMAFVTRNVSLRRRFLLEAGGFDENFQGWGGEDWDLGYRLKKQGAIFDCREDVINYHQEHPIIYRKKTESRRNGLYMLAKHRAPELCFIPGETGKWTLHHYGKFVKQYLDLKERPEEQGLVESFASLMMAIVSRNTGNKIDEDLRLDMLSISGSRRRVGKSHHEFMATFDALLHSYLNKPDAEPWKMHFQEADLQEMEHKARYLGEMLPDNLINDYNYISKLASMDEKELIDFLDNCKDKYSEEIQPALQAEKFLWTSLLQDLKIEVNTPTNGNPFADILYPLVNLAKKRAKYLSGGSYEQNIDIEIRSRLEKTLWQYLLHIASPTLKLHWALFQRNYSGNREVNSDKQIDKLKLDFVKHYLYGNLQKLLYDYPVLSRLLVTICEHWARTVGSEQLKENISFEPSAIYWRLFRSSLQPKYMRYNHMRILELTRIESQGGSLATLTGIPIIKLETQVLNFEVDETGLFSPLKDCHSPYTD